MCLVALWTYLMPPSCALKRDEDGRLYAVYFLATTEKLYKVSGRVRVGSPFRFIHSKS